MNFSNTIWSIERNDSPISLELNRYFGKSKIVFFSNQKFCLMDGWNNVGVEFFDYRVRKEFIILKKGNQEIKFSLALLDMNNIKLTSGIGEIQLKRTNQLDIEGNLKTYFPAIIEFLGDMTLDWNRIQNQFESRLYSRMFLFLSSDPEFTKEYELSLFDVIQLAIKGDRDTLAQMKFFNDIIRDLCELLDDSEIKLVKNTMYNILIEQDMKFKNYIGELAILHRLKTLGYYLAGSEVRLFDEGKKNTKIDFKFRKVNHVKYVEVRNLHLTQSNTNTDLEIKRLLEKIPEKFREKGCNPLKPYWVYPVVWGQFDEIQRLNEYIKNNSIRFERIFQPVALMIYSHPDNENVMMYKFASLEEIVKKQPID